MYIATEQYKNRSHFFLRETIEKDGRLTHRDLYDLGSAPSGVIKYPGGNAFHFDEAFEDELSRIGAKYTDDTLEDLFWPWLRPDIRRAIETFQSRGRKSKKPLSKAHKQEIAARVHPFDKRRAHYLKFGAMDQGPLENMPTAVFKHLADCCRDEIEQTFLRQEKQLRANELKSYVFTAFDLQSYFQGFLAKKMPQALNQKKVDTFFAKELCRLNLNLFEKNEQLDDYMLRYAIMFFDHPYADTKLLDEMARDFMFRHRSHRQPPMEKKTPVRQACKIFDISKSELKKLTKRELTQKYRKLARKVHPDTGGSNDQFVRLNDAYKSLLARINRPKRS